MPFDVHDAFSVSVATLHEQGRQAAPRPDEFKLVAVDRNLPTSEVRLGKLNRNGGMIPFPDNVRVERRLEMSDSRMATQPFQDTLVAEAVRFQDLNYVAAFGEAAYDMGYAQESHPNQLTFGALANSHEDLYVVTKAGKSVKFEMKGYDGKPLLAEDHPLPGQPGETISNRLNVGGPSNRWYVLAMNDRRPLIFGRTIDYDFDEFDQHRFDETREYRYRAYAHVGVGVQEWRSIVSSRAEFNNESLTEAIVQLARFTNDHGDKRGPVVPMVVAPYDMREEVLTTLRVQTVSGQINYQTDVQFVLSTWLMDQPQA